MGSCRCGGKTVPFKPAKISKGSVKPANISKGGDGKNLSGRAKRLQTAAVKKANRNATGCQCTQ